MRKTMMFATAGSLVGMTAAERSKGRFMRAPDGHSDAGTLEMKTWVEGVEEKLKKHGVDAALLVEMKERLTEVEQKMARRPGAGPVEAPPSIGAKFIEEKSDELARIATDRGRTSMEFKSTITSATADAAGSAGALDGGHRDGLVTMPKRRLTIRGLLNVVPVASGSAEYAKQTGRTFNAAPTAEGDAKPQSDIKFSLETVPMRVIAHFMKASRQIIEDVPQLKATIDNELRYGLALKEEAELLYGDGTGQHLEGMVAQAADYAGTITAVDESIIDRVGFALLQCALTDLEPDGIVLHPSDWWRMRLLKDNQGRYILGDPMSVGPTSLFQRPIVVTPAMQEGEFLVGAFGAQTLYDRWAARVEVGFVDDDFTRNLVTVLGEERVGFAAKQPQSLITGSFSDLI